MQGQVIFDLAEPVALCIGRVGGDQGVAAQKGDHRLDQDARLRLGIGWLRVLLAERARGTDWVESCRRANVAGAITVTRRGPATAPTASEIDAFLAGLSAGGGGDQGR